MAAEPVQETVAGGDTAITEQDRDLVKRLRAKRPEVPLHVHVAKIGPGMALLGVNEHLELVGIADEEDGRVVADQIPVPLFGVKPEGEAANVAFGISSAAFPGNGRETQECFGRLADLLEQPGPGKSRDVAGDGKCAVRAGALGMDRPLGNPLAIEVLHLLDKLDILHEDRPTGTGGHGLLETNRGSVGCRDDGALFLFHKSLR